MKNTKVRILLIVPLAIIIVVLAWYISSRQINQDILLVSITTDRQEYRVGDTVLISIRNLGDHSIDIYCPEWCALGNFPTTVERFANGQWEYFAGFCPSIEPLFGSGLHEGDYIRHTLSARSTFELEISNFEALHLQQDEKLRIVYYLDSGKVSIYSNEFIIKQ
jgi:hypothetical protein